MKQVLLASTTMLLVAGSAMAGDRSSALKAEEHSHIKVVPYSATKRTEVIGLLKQPTTITFPAGENVYRVVQSQIKTTQDGDNTAWKEPSPDQVKDAPLGNNLTIWPMQEGTTIMNVITMGEHGGQKSYAFKLIAKPDPTGMPDDPDAVFNVIFKGGGDPVLKQAPARSDGDEAIPRKSTAAVSDDPPPRKPRSHRETTREANERELAADRLRVDAFNRAEGCHYHGQGDANSPIKPFCPLDNGIWTIMRLAGLSQKPTVYVGVCDGQGERLARQVGSGDFIVVQEIAPTFCLRLGSYALNIINDTYNPAGTPTGNGTISTGAERQILQESRK